MKLKLYGLLMVVIIQLHCSQSMLTLDPITRLKLRQKASAGTIDATIPGGVTSLYAASTAGLIEFMEALITLKDNVNWTDPETGWTPLHAAALTNQQKAISLLLVAGADKTRKNNFGKTAYDIAQQNGHAVAAQLLSSTH